jgi:hypothetical protein
MPLPYGPYCLPPAAGERHKSPSFLNAQGAEISMLQVFMAGFGAYLFLLGKHRVFNHRYFEQHAVDITPSTARGCCGFAWCEEAHRL